jgi:eukaryotic-like serine/threonine-protein kinase
MTPERWRQIEALYRAAQDCGPEERAGLLEHCDPEIRAAVERMLAQSSGAKILDQPAAELFAAATETMVGVGSEFGPYKIEAILGSGGMGTVFRAVDGRLGRTVAIKVATARYSERFEREASAISALNHPHICTLYDVGPNYMVMELIEGSTLAEEIKKGPLETAEVARLGAQIASALAEAHAHGIVHRDLKPSNIMITRYGAKVLDFGLAKVASNETLTESNVIMGTPLYMAPEQMEGLEAGARADLFALGLVLYEMVVGKLPFPAASLGRMLSSGSQVAVPPPSQEREGVPPALDRLIGRLLEKDPEQRWGTAAEAAKELEAIVGRLIAPPTAARSLLRPVFLVPAALVLLAVVGAGIGLQRRSEHRRWAREEAIPEINQFTTERKSLAAYLVLKQAEQYLPGDPTFAEMEKNATRVVSVTSSPSGAKVEIQDYLSPDGAWLNLGTTALDHVRIPNGYFRWRISKAGAGEWVSAPPPILDKMSFSLQPPEGAQAGTVPVPGNDWTDLVDFIGWIHFHVPSFDLDRFEVTNRQYQKFVDEGGYRKPEYWKEKFVKDGKELTWQQAMDLFRDPTGRPGPSTWEAGHYPQGQADFPVSGVSWYEAAAYAAYAGRSLPTFGQWEAAAPAIWTIAAVNVSNFGGRGPAAVGTSAGVGLYGNYDLAGNVREWSLNADESGGRFILGGAWRTQTYQAFDPESLPPFDRSSLNGFRTVHNREPLDAAARAPLVRTARDFSKVKPVPDDVFQAYRTMYAYDRRPLSPQADSVEETPYWTKQKITIDAGYESERLPMYLFLPKNVHPPFQAVLFFPSARVNLMPSSRNLGDLQFVDYVIKSGRALLYPIYFGTYERTASVQPGTIGDLQLVIKQSKEVRRAVDYFETRPDIDKNKLAYLGVSQGSAYGVIYTALEDRFKAVIFLDGGLFLGPTLPARDQVNFAPRIKKPVLMVNGEYDYTFSPERAQLPLLKMIGTPEADKRRVVSATSHDVSQDAALLSREVLGWLDKYLGKVN